MKFNFKFQKILDREKFFEEALAKELELIQNELKVEEGRREALKDALTKRQSEMKTMLSERGEAGIFVLFEIYFSKLNEGIILQETKIKEISERIDHTREKLFCVFKKRKALEKLRERHEKEFRNILLRQENKQLNEIATSRYFYNFQNEVR
ncbi:MAG: flagellar export protein FliJ [Candidatus Brocadiaceae bacterium]|nr:flagellar export protein FliJ [Candidatus Brocadiaceae bacterium]